ncbi:TPA: type II toxin-antitoxin system mRNA interferase toxin, RelE/StbE family [Candidatus Nomurabacteria bacterium]|nr:type II toxin-antitoxin system mRNA interferase toxin, RelE/StbE family [Candidatus Nomurabacteria bacterium]
MEIFYSPSFARSYKKLPDIIKDKAEKREKIFRKDWKDARLKTHKLNGKFSEFLAFSIDNSYRIIFDFDENKNVIFHGIGDHDIYR